MRATLKTYAVSACGFVSLLLFAKPANAQSSVASDASIATCAAMLSDIATGVRVTDSSSTSVRNTDTTIRFRSDTASFGIGRGRNGGADIILRVGVHADEVRFAKQPNVRVRLCWGGDTLRVVQRDNLPSPIVPGTTYRNVYVAVELVGRLNGECLANILGVGTSAPATRSQSSNAQSSSPAGSSATDCAFLGGSAGTGAQSARPPTP